MSFSENLKHNPVAFILVLWALFKITLVFYTGLSFALPVYQGGSAPVHTTDWAIVLAPIFSVAYLVAFRCYPARVMQITLGLMSLGALILAVKIRSFLLLGSGLNATVDAFFQGSADFWGVFWFGTFMSVVVWLGFGLLNPEKYGLSWLAIRLPAGHDAMLFATEEPVTPECRLRRLERCRFYQGVYLIPAPFLWELVDLSMLKRRSGPSTCFFMGTDSQKYAPDVKDADGIDCLLFPGGSWDNVTVGGVQVPNPPVPNGVIPELQIEEAPTGPEMFTNVLDAGKELREAAQRLMVDLVGILGAVGMIQVREIFFVVDGAGIEIDRIDERTDVARLQIRMAPHLARLCARLQVVLPTGTGAPTLGNQVATALRNYWRKIRAAGHVATLGRKEDCTFANPTVNGFMTMQVQASQEAMGATARAEAARTVFEQQMRGVIAGMGRPAADFEAAQLVEIARMLLVGRTGAVPFINVSGGRGTGGGTPPTT